MNYFIYGSELYLINQRKLQIQNNATQINADCEFFSADSPDISHTINLALNLTLFSDQKYVFIDHLEIAKTKELKLISEKLLPAPKGIVLIFIWNGKLKKQELNTSPLKEITAGAKIYEENTPTGTQLIDWIIKETERYGKKITSDAASLLAIEIPDDMWSLSLEIEKCICYTGEKKLIEVNDVEKNLYQKSAGNIFEFGKMIECKNKRDAAKILKNLTESGLEPLVILDRIHKTFLRIYQGKILLKSGMDRPTASRRIGLHPYYDSKFFDSIGNYTDKELADAFKIISEYNLKLKRISNQCDKQFLLTDLLARILT